MSSCRRCDYWKATDGKWYVCLGDFEHANDDDECTNYGPFASEDAAEKYVHDNHSNPGGSCHDDSGTCPPPKDPVRPHSGFGGYRSSRFLR